MMKKIMTGVAAATIMGGALAIPTQANALAEWVIPTIVATGLGGVMVGSAAANNNPYYGYAEPAGRSLVARPGLSLLAASALLADEDATKAARIAAGGGQCDLRASACAAMGRVLDDVGDITLLPNIVRDRIGFHENRRRRR
jgi:hypothetical protein